jgi:hypothetical protein
VENKTHGLGTESNFDFKYIPNFQSTTSMGDYEVSGLKEPGIERRNFMTLVVASAIVGIMSYIVMRTTFGFVGSIRTWFS